MEPVDHICRPALPWRTGPRLTECGLFVAKVKTLTREEYANRVKSMGYQRASLFTCMTCSDTASRHGSWEDDPRQAIAREIEWETRWCGQRKREPLLKDELSALAILVERHTDEFDSLVSETRARREWNVKKQERQT